ncbi:nucleoporin Nup85-like protein [Fennellomyces sp. T-0311]|nr:nucleoporin Nup85-like protein [Fennellomyces sp. T-0311]
MLSDYVASMTRGKRFEDFIKSEGAGALAECHRYHQITRLWELCHILYFTDQEDEPTGVKLLNWLNEIDKSIYRFDVQGIIAHKTPIDHPEFWPYVYKLILRREHRILYDLIKIVKSRLSAHKEAAQLVEHLLVALNGVPSIPNEADRADQYSKDWTKWREKVHKVAESFRKAHGSAYRMQYSSLLNSLGLLYGDTKSILSFAEHPTEALISLIVNAHPFATPDKIRAVTRVLDLHFNGELKHFSAFAKVIQGDIGPGLELFSPKDWWLLTHLVDLLGMTVAANSIATMNTQIFSPERKQRYMMPFRTFLVLVYVRLLSEHEKIWGYGLDYLSTCGPLGRVALDDYINSMPSNSTSATERLLDYCIDHGYVKQVMMIYECQANRGVRGSYSRAIQYLCRTGEYSILEQICESAVYHYARTGELADTGNLPAQLHNYSRSLPHVEFFIQFSQLHYFYENHDYDEAAEFLYDILLSENTATHFIPLLFVEGMTVIEVDQQFSRYTENQVISIRLLLNDLLNRDNIPGMDLLALYMERIHGIPVQESRDGQDTVQTAFREYVDLISQRYSYHSVVASNTEPLPCID